MAVNIQIDSISYSYPTGIEALNGISLSITQGESLAIIGQNGSGKTTLAKHLNGLLKPYSGSVNVGGRDTRFQSVSHLASLVGFVFQNPDDQLFKPSVWAEVIFGPTNLGFSKEEIAKRSLESLTLVQLERHSNKHPYDLSPSERKRVALASVLAMNTPIIVLDEPTSGQDHAGVERIGFIVDMLKKLGKTIITITHDIDFCAEHFDRVLLMANGTIILDGLTREVLNQTSLLSRNQIDPPQLIRLATGLHLLDKPLTVKEFVNNFERLLK